MAEPVTDEQLEDELATELAYLNQPPHIDFDQPDPEAPPHIDFDQPETPPPHIDFDVPEAPGSTSVSAGMRMSGSGFGPDTGQGAVWAKGYEQFAESDQRLRANAQLGMAETSQAVGRLQDSIDLEAGVTAEASVARAALLQDREKFLRDSAELDKIMYAQVRAEGEQYVNAYQQQIAAVRQMTVSNPIETLSGFQAAGLSLAMFAQGFLAAQGINIDVSGQVDRWVDRSIEEQKRRIGQAEAGARDQLDLWRIAQETSQNDLEARHRYRGMVLEAMTTAVEINAARFAAPLARAAAEVAKAKLEVEKVNVNRAIREQYERDREVVLKGMRDEMHKRVEERHRAWGLSIQAKEAETRAKLASAKQGKSPNLLIDSRNVKRGADGKPLSGGLVVGELSHDAPTETQKKVIGLKALNDATQSGMDELRRLYKDLDGEAGPGWLRNRTSEAYTLFNAERNRIIGDIMRNFTGLAATDKEAQRWLDQLGNDAFIQAGPDRLPKLMDGMAEWARRSFEQSLDLPGVIKYKPTERFYDEQVAVDPEGSALAEARKKTASPTSGPAKAAGDATTRDNEMVEGQSEFYRQFHKPESKLPRLQLPSIKEVAAGDSRSEGWARDLELLARTAVDPEGQFRSVASGYEKFGGKVPDLSKEELAKRAEQAHEALIDIAAGKSLGEAANEEALEGGWYSGKTAFTEGPDAGSRQKYARALLDALNRDPKSLLEQLK